MGGHGVHRVWVYCTTSGFGCQPPNNPRGRSDGGEQGGGGFHDDELPQVLQRVLVGSRSGDETQSESTTG